MTTARNPVSVDAQRLPQEVPVTSNLTINAGDLVYWDGTNFTATPLSAATQVAGNFLGVSEDSAPALIYPNPPDAPRPSITVVAKGVVRLLSTAGETYNHFDAVTVGADAQTVVKSGATSGNRVGFVIIDPPLVARPNQATPVPETVGGAAQVELRVQLEPKHPVAALV